MKFVDRHLEARVDEYAEYFPVTAIIGPRQCGKTTLAKMWMRKRSNTTYLDLELPSDAAKLENAEDYLRAHRGELICLDEIQRAPGIFKVLRALTDETGRSGQLLILGSASPDLLRQSSETLAGRIGYLELTPLNELEVGSDRQERLWLRGGFPRSLLAPNDRLSGAWLENFIQTFLERDIPQLGIRVPSVTLRQFWQMCAHLHGELWNHEKVASALGVTGKTVRHYVEILIHAFMLRRLLPFQANVKKRIVKTPRVYLRDTGVLHQLLRINSLEDLAGHPVRGVSWEGYVLEQVASTLQDVELSFYRTSAGAEIDLVIRRGSRTAALEMKATSAPQLTKGFWSARDDVKPEKTWVVAPVQESYSIAGSVVAAPPSVVLQELQQFFQ